MKVRPSISKTSENCVLVKRKGRIYVINKENQKFGSHYKTGNDGLSSKEEKQI